MKKMMADAAVPVSLVGLSAAAAPAAMAIGNDHRAGRGPATRISSDGRIKMC